MITGEFSAERAFARPLSEVWRGYSDPALRALWRSVPGSRSRFSVDFRPGGREVAEGIFAPSGVDEAIVATADFLDIVDHDRIVFASSLRLDGVLRWASLVTVVFSGGDATTSVRHTEQFSFLAYDGDGENDVAHLRGGLNLQWNRFEVALDSLRADTSQSVRL
ncbi:SRPBCC domain-containing protein [Microbacterium xylanilyticum]